jgi:hypothetical protein
MVIYTKDNEANDNNLNLFCIEKCDIKETFKLRNRGYVIDIEKQNILLTFTGNGSHVLPHTEFLYFFIRLNQLALRSKNDPMWYSHL